MFIRLVTDVSLSVILYTRWSDHSCQWPSNLGNLLVDYVPQKDILDYSSSMTFLPNQSGLFYYSVV